MMYRGHPSIGREVSEGVDQSHEDHPSLRTAILIESRGCSQGNPKGGTPELQGLQCNDLVYLPTYPDIMVMNNMI